MAGHTAPSPLAYIAGHAAAFFPHPCSAGVTIQCRGVLALGVAHCAKVVHAPLGLPPYSQASAAPIGMHAPPSFGTEAGQLLSEGAAFEPDEAQPRGNVTMKSAAADPRFTLLSYPGRSPRAAWADPDTLESASTRPKVAGALVPSSRREYTWAQSL